MMGAVEKPSMRAAAIANGLMRTGRAANPLHTCGFICLHTAGAHRYWVSFDGQRVLRGRDLADADELQDGFIEAMIRAGERAGPEPQ